MKRIRQLLSDAKGLWQLYRAYCHWRKCEEDKAKSQDIDSLTLAKQLQSAGLSKANAEAEAQKYFEWRKVSNK